MRLPNKLSREQVQTLAFAAVVTIVPILLCGYMFGFDIPLASAKFWINPKNDMLAMTGAYEAFIRQPWGFPLATLNDLLPKPVSIVFSDSIPWLAILLKASGLGPWFNPLGLFLMLSYPLQAWGMVALLRSLGVQKPIPLIVGAFMALLFPAWIMRQFGHIALSGHWVILFALALSVSSARFGLTARRVLGFVVVAGLATGIHAYHLIPVAACFGAALLSELSQGRADAWKRVPIAAIAVMTTVAASALVLGYDQGGGEMGGAAALGYYSMNALGPVWPQAARLFGQIWNGGWFTGVMDPTGGQYFEGFQYLGGGALLLVAVMVFLLVRDLSVGRRPKGAFWARWWPLVAACVVLTVWSIGWNIYAGPLKVAELPKPSGAIAEALGVFRCHGRFFWAVGYLLTALAINWTSRLPAKVSLPLLGVALALQVVDTSPPRQGVRQTFSGPDPYAYPAELAKSPAARGRDWFFRPTFFCTPSALDQQFISQLNLLAVRTGGTTNTFGTARNNDAACDVVPAGVSQDAGPGDRRVVVLLSNGELEGKVFAPIARRSDCYRFRRGVFCGRGLAGVGDTTPLLPGELSAQREAKWVERMDNPKRPAALGAGWAQLDPGGAGVWSIAHEAVLLIPAPAVVKPDGFLVELTLIGFSPEPSWIQRVRPSVNGQELIGFKVEPGAFFTYRFRVPARLAPPGKLLQVKLGLPDALVTKGDPRMLGVGLQQVRILD